MDYLKSLMEERETLAATIETYALKASERGSDLTEAETAEVKRIQERCASIDDRLATFGQAQESSRRYADLVARIGTAPKPEERKAEEPEHLSMGEAFARSAEFRGYQFHGSSSRFHYGEGRAAGDPFLTSSLHQAPAQVTVAEAPDQNPLLAVINREQISTNAFEYVLYADDDLAAVVPEGTAKPETTISTTLVPGSLDTIAHWTEASRQALEDESRLRSIIDGRLSRGVLRKVNSNVNAALVAATLPTAAGDDLLAAIRVGIGTVEANGWSPNAVILNPADWAALDIAAMAATQVGPVVRQSFWGLTVISSSLQTAGTATVGDFQQGVSLFYRAGVAVYATDSHASNFTSNLFTILAEMRAKAVVTDTTALVECAATVAP
jgi:HK97 family phage major capsid protein